MTTIEAAKKLGVHKSCVTRLVAAGFIEADKIRLRGNATKLEVLDTDVYRLLAAYRRNRLWRRHRHRKEMTGAALLARANRHQQAGFKLAELAKDLGISGAALAWRLYTARREAKRSYDKL
jgi:excisionase family DNA binding protein